MLFLIINIVFFYVFVGAPTGPDPRRVPGGPRGGPRGGPDPRRAPLGPHQGPGLRRARSPQGPTSAQGPAGPDARRAPLGPRAPRGPIPAGLH